MFTPSEKTEQTDVREVWISEDKIGNTNSNFIGFIIEPVFVYSFCSIVFNLYKKEGWLPKYLHHEEINQKLDFVFLIQVYWVLLGACWLTF